jgi:phosphatidylserine synthase
MMGLSIGVHLLNLLTIPAIVMIYYYRRYKVSTSGAIVAFLVGCAITGLVQVGIIQYSMKAAGQFDVYFVNTLNLPFFSGFAIYFIALFALIIWALRFNEKNTSQVKLIIWFVLFLFLSALPFVIIPGTGIKVFRLLLILSAAAAIGYFIKLSALKILKLSLWCYAFMLIGYFMYFTTLIRSNANPSIDMNNVDNPINLVYYLSREQYGEAPLLYGPHFAAKVPDDINREEPFIEGEMKYVKGDKKYIASGRKKEYNFNSDVKQLFPRIWDSSNDQYHADFYADWLDLRDERGEYVAPTMKDNIQWFFEYQMSHMYWRYFMWNFSGNRMMYKAR